MRLISFCQAQLQLLLTGSWDSINVNFSTQPPHTQPHLLTWLSKFWSLDPTFDFFSVHLYFDLLIWKMLHDILPTRERMNRMNLPGVPSAVCTLCDGNAEDTSEHALLTCSYIRVGSENFLLASRMNSIVISWRVTGIVKLFSESRTVRHPWHMNRFVYHILNVSESK